jgi:FMN phosphatase YigB (HAD superfamily)
MEAQIPELRLEVRPTVRARSPRELVIFSLDDTLVDTSIYWLARTALGRVLAARTGKTQESINSVHEAPDRESKRMYEVSAERDFTTMQETWLAFQNECNLPRDGDTKLYSLVTGTLRQKYPSAIPGAEDLLKWAQSRFTLALLTSGDPGIQRQKLEAVKFEGYFKKIQFVPSKGTEEFAALITGLGFSARNSWVVGSSLSLDIEPATRAGANCILYTYPHPKLGGRRVETGEPMGATFRVHDLLDAMAILAKPV